MKMVRVFSLTIFIFQDIFRPRLKVWDETDHSLEETMSNTIRWIIAILLILFGITAAAFAFFGGAFSTIACQQTPPDWVYYILLAAAAVTLVAPVIAAVMLIRKANGTRVIIALVSGGILSTAGYAAYITLLGQNC